jgi:hypothetical protein
LHENYLSNYLDLLIFPTGMIIVTLIGSVLYFQYLLERKNGNKYPPKSSRRGF